MGARRLMVASWKFKAGAITPKHLADRRERKASKL